MVTDEDQLGAMVLAQQLKTMVGTLLSSFADMASETRSRMVEAGWSEEAAEQFVLNTTSPMVGVFMARIAMPTDEGNDEAPQ